MTNPTTSGLSFDALESAYSDDLIENGAWLHFVGPDGEPLFIPTGQKDEKQNPIKVPVRARVRSMLSVKYDQHMDRLQTGASSRARKLKGEEARRKLLLKEMKENQPKAFAALVSELENISAGALGTVTPPESDLLHFALQPRNKVWVDQVLEFAADNANFGADAEGNTPGNADGADAG